MTHADHILEPMTAKCTCAFCDGVTRQHIAVLDSIANSEKALLQWVSAISSAQPSITNATSCKNRKRIKYRRSYKKKVWVMSISR